MKTFTPTTGSPADWNAAYYRLEDYFRALRLVNKVHQSQIILKILEAAAARHAQEPEQNPTALAMEEAHSALTRWFGTILGHRERLAVVGLISFLAVDTPEKWPLAILSEDVPADLHAALRDSEVRAGPDLQVSSMVPRPIDVSPLLEPMELARSLGRAWHSVAFLATAVVLGALSLSLFFYLKHSL